MTGEQVFGLRGKVALVTGGAGIIGAATCEALAKSGAKVAVVDIDGAAAFAVAGRIVEKSPGAAKGFQCDVADPASVAHVVRDVVAQFGSINVLHNNAATKGDDLAGFLRPVEEYSLDTWRSVMNVNVDGMFLMAQAVGRQID